MWCYFWSGDADRTVTYNAHSDGGPMSDAARIWELYFIFGPKMESVQKTETLCFLRHFKHVFIPEDIILHDQNMNESPSLILP